MKSMVFLFPTHSLAETPEGFPATMPRPRFPPWRACPLEGRAKARTKAANKEHKIRFMGETSGGTALMCFQWEYTHWDTRSEERRVGKECRAGGCRRS